MTMDLSALFKGVRFCFAWGLVWRILTHLINPILCEIPTLTTKWTSLWLSIWVMRKWAVGKEGCHTMNCKIMIITTYLYCSRESHLFRLKLETMLTHLIYPTFSKIRRFTTKWTCLGHQYEWWGNGRLGTNDDTPWSVWWWYWLILTVQGIHNCFVWDEWQILANLIDPIFFQDSKIYYRVDMSVVMKKRKVANKWR